MSKFFNRITSPRRLLGISKPGELGYSDINIALQDIKDVGTCDPAIVREGVARFKKTGLLNDDEFLYLFGIFTRKVKENQKSDQFFDELRISRIFHESMDELIDQRTRDLTDPLLTRPESELTPVELELRNAKRKKLNELSSLRSCDSVAPPSGDALALYESLKGAFDFDRRKAARVVEDGCLRTVSKTEIRKNSNSLRSNMSAKDLPATRRSYERSTKPWMRNRSRRPSAIARRCWDAPVSNPRLTLTPGSGPGS